MTSDADHVPDAARCGQILVAAGPAIAEALAHCERGEVHLYMRAVRGIAGKVGTAGLYVLARKLLMTLLDGMMQGQPLGLAVVPVGEFDGEIEMDQLAQHPKLRPVIAAQRLLSEGPQFFDEQWRAAAERGADELADAVIGLGQIASMTRAAREAEFGCEAGQAVFAPDGETVFATDDHHEKGVMQMSERLVVSREDSGDVSLELAIVGCSTAAVGTTFLAPDARRVAAMMLAGGGWEKAPVSAAGFGGVAWARPDGLGGVRVCVSVDGPPVREVEVTIPAEEARVLAVRLLACTDGAADVA